MLKTNLSTLTTNAPTSPGKDQVGTSSPYMADFSQPEKFLRLLWEGSVTGTGGYTLHYSAGPRQEGLPNQVFTAGSEARLALLVLLGSQSDQAIANRKLYPFNNCVVVGDNIDPAAQSVFVSPTDATAENMVNLPTFSPGNIGFKLERFSGMQSGIAVEECAF